MTSRGRVEIYVLGGSPLGKIYIYIDLAVSSFLL